MKCITIAVAVCFSAQLCFGTIINVPSEQPTIQAGINAASDGDTVLVAAGIYYENVICQKSVNLIGSGADQTVWDASGGTIGLNINMSFIPDSRGVIRGFTFQNCPDISAHYCVRISTTGDSRWDVMDNVFRDNGWISLVMGDTGQVCRNLFIDNEYAVQTTRGPTIRNNTFIQNHVGVYLYGPAHVECNIIISGDYGIYRGTAPGATVDYNDIWNNIIDYYQCPPGPNDISADPLFVGGSPFDYHLQCNSPCVDAGNPAHPSDPDGTRADMGAFPLDQTAAVFEPDPSYIYYKFAFVPMYATVYVGNFVGDLVASDVLDAEVEGVQATITGILPSYPGFEGEVLQLDIPIAPFLEGYGAPLDTTSQNFTVTGTFTDQTTFCAVGDVDLIGKSSASGGTQWILPPDEVVLHGDVDASGHIDIDDVTTIISAIFQGGSFFGPLMIADCNCSHAVDIDDVVYLINYIFSGGNAAGDPDGDEVPDC